MTGLQRLERRLQRIRSSLAIGLGLYSIPMVAAHFVPWLALLVPVGVAVTLGAIATALRSFRCPECGGKLGHLLLIKQSGKLFALPANLAACPHCACDLTTQRGHDDLLEILSAYEMDGECIGVVGTPMNGVVHQYEIKLNGAARRTFTEIMQLHPFGRHGGGTRYFFVPSPQSETDSPSSPIRIRVEQGQEDTTVEVRAPKPLRTLLEWLRQLQDSTQIAQLSLREV